MSPTLTLMPSSEIILKHQRKTNGDLNLYLKDRGHNANGVMCMNQAIERKKKSVTRTFRINKEWDDVLQKEALEQGVSVNVLMNKILRRYALFERWADKYEVLHIMPRTLERILDVASEEGLAEAGQAEGSVRPIDSLTMMGRRPSHESLVSLVTEFYGGTDFARWFQCDYYPELGSEVFHLRHRLGNKWSIFIKNYLTSMFESLLKTKVESKAMDQAVTLTLEKPPKHSI